jgi:mannose-6-phosphate isomerase-like protein (cupin superfamily)
MDVRSIADVEPQVEHNGTVPVWYLVQPREIKDITDGGFVELINEFEVAADGAVFPHSHPTHEWYFVMSGRGVMSIDDEERSVGPGDLVYIPPDHVHSLRPVGGGAIHCFCFAVGVKGAAAVNYTSH